MYTQVHVHSGVAWHTEKAGRGTNRRRMRLLGKVGERNMARVALALVVVAVALFGVCTADNGAEDKVRVLL